MITCWRCTWHSNEFHYNNVHAGRTWHLSCSMTLTLSCISGVAPASIIRRATSSWLRHTAAIRADQPDCKVRYAPHKWIHLDVNTHIISETHIVLKVRVSLVFQKLHYRVVSSIPGSSHQGCPVLLENCFLSTTIPNHSVYSHRSVHYWHDWGHWGLPLLSGALPQSLGCLIYRKPSVHSSHPVSEEKRSMLRWHLCCCMLLTSVWLLGSAPIRRRIRTTSVCFCLHAQCRALHPSWQYNEHNP